MTAYSPDPRDLGPEAPGDSPGGRAARRGEVADALARASRYSRWDGSQHVAELDADEILDALADDVMAEGDLAEAIRRLMDRGWRTGDPSRGDMPGLRDLLERLERQREELLDRYKLTDVLGDIRREIDEIVTEERTGVERRLDEAARPGASDEDARLRSMLRDAAARRLDQLDALPSDIGQRIRGLQDYDFLEPNARERFDDLVKRLQGQVLDQFVSGMSDAIRSMSPKDLAAIDRDEVRDLLGPDAARDLAALDDLARRLEEAGYLTRDGERLELTPRGSRRIGQK
ncbi:MAG TPA: hypothetical protein VHM48_10840, partial [Candidatus Limnocylindrales bacterium]|nr:hypothetical protein [Candidatus Limnocylindrales bacterium]